jgi:hypothetical protein
MTDYFYTKTIIILSLALLLSINCYSQQLRNYQGNYTLNSITTGTANYSYYNLPEDSMQFHGRFVFSSDVLQFDNNKVRQINISGNYRRGYKNGEWVFERNDFVVKYNRITGTNIESVLDGTIKRLNARYNDGLAEGRWSLRSQEVKNSRRLSNFASSEANFRGGKASGKFIFSDPSRDFPINIEGQFDEIGNFDGTWKLLYELGGVRYNEERIFSNGFLLYLNLKNARTNEVFIEEEYDDVKAKLNLLKEEGNDANFKMGDKQFGILFNDGYRENDMKLVGQQIGNEILREAFDFYTDSSGVLFSLPGFKTPVMGHTRRFQYVYPDNEDGLIEILRPMVVRMENQYDSTLNTSVLRINREKSDTIAFYYELLELALEKSKIIQSALNEIESGIFDYQFRDNFYRNGVHGLKSSDTLWYQYHDKELYKIINVGDAVSTPDSLVMNIYRYAISLETYIDRFYDQVSSTLLSLQQEDRIARLDETIINVLDTFLLTYTGDPKINLSLPDAELRKAKSLNDLQLSIFKRFGREILKQNMQQYIEIDDFEMKELQGKRIVELVRTLIDLFPKLERIPRLAAELDEVYTRYSPNPFFEREVVSRIKQGIYSRGAELLLPHKIEELKKSTTKDELVERVNAIFKLDEKLRELAVTDDQETSRLNARIRRENQPERIKRLLGL